MIIQLIAVFVIDTVILAILWLLKKRVAYQCMNTNTNNNIRTPEAYHTIT